jgi:hypothetical protein
MHREFASAVFASLFAMPFGARADDGQPPPPLSEHHAPATDPKPNTAAKRAAAAGHTQADARATVSPVAITAKRAHLDLRLSSESLNRVLYDSGVEPVAEADSAVETVEVSAQRVRQEPITQGIPAIYYGITHPTEAWRIFAPIQP